MQELLADKIRNYNFTVWLLNTGWTGGPYGIGHRMKLSHTRKMLSEALKGNLNDVTCETDPIFELSIPQKIDGVPNNILNPRNTWDNKQAYNQKAKKLAAMFADNFRKFKEDTDKELVQAGP